MIRIIKIFFSFFILLASFLTLKPVLAVEELNIYAFHGQGCPHCEQEKEFFDEVITPKYPQVVIHEYEVYRNREHANLLKESAEILGVRVEGVPFLVIGDKHFTGYVEGATSRAIEEQIKDCSLNACPDPLASLLLTAEPDVDERPLPPDVVGDDIIVEIEEPILEPNENAEDIALEKESSEKMIKLPLLGEVDALSFSLPVLTIVLGALDGFNPCAMWTLIFLIGLLLGMKDRKRMWLLGSVFIVASASVYFIFMAAWLNLIIFLGFVMWVRIMIGALALFGGGYSLREFFVNKNSACKVTGGEKRRRVFDRMKEAVHQNNLWLALGGIIILAFAVNLVELICSAGLPAVYTQILALNDMSSWQYYFYIALYILFFMLDDLLIFIIAMITLEMTGLTTKYVRASRLVGGILMLAIGLLLIFKPEWLMFG